MTPSLPRAEAHLAVEIERIARSGEAAVLRYLDELLTVEDVAAWVRVEPATVYRWVSRGTAPKHSKVGDLVRFRRADVRAWLAERTVEPASAPPRRYRRRQIPASHAAAPQELSS